MCHLIKNFLSHFVGAYNLQQWVPLLSSLVCQPIHSRFLLSLSSSPSSSLLKIALDEVQALGKWYPITHV